MFKFRVEEDSGYVYETNTLRTLERYLAKNCLPRTFRFEVSLDKNFEFCEELKVTDRLLMLLNRGSNDKHSVKGVVNLGYYDEKNEYNDSLHCDTACDEYTHHKNRFIEELLISCMLNNSPALRQAYNKGLIDVQVIIESNTNWKYVLNVTDKYLENEGAVVVKPFDSVRSISNPMLLNPNLFNAYILFCMLTGKPVALFPEVAVRSGYIGDKKPDKVAD